MSNYKFETTQFGLSDNGIHLLRSGYNYETIDFSKIEKIEIIKGKQVKNWLLLLIIGIVLLAFGLFTAFKVVYEYFFANNFHTFYIEQFLLPVFPLFLGPYSIYYAIKVGHLLSVTINNKTRRLPIEELYKNAQLNDLNLFLNQNSFTKNKFNQSW